MEKQAIYLHLDVRFTYEENEGTTTYSVSYVTKTYSRELNYDNDVEWIAICINST